MKKDYRINIPSFRKVYFLLSLILLLFYSNFAFSNGGIGYKGVKINLNGNNSWYNIHGVPWAYQGCGNYSFYNNGNENWNGTNLGTFSNTATLQITGYAVAGWTDNSDYVAGKLEYMVWKQGDPPPSSWTIINVGYYQSPTSGATQVVCTSGNDRIVGYENGSTDIQPGVPGTYNFKVRGFGRMQYTGGGGGSFNPNDGTELTATFTVATPAWTGSAWSNGTGPTSSINAIIDGDLTTSTDLACKDLTINVNRTLTIAAGNKLTVSGNLINNGTILFKSNATATAMFDVFNGTQSGSGVVTTERYIPAKRAFRFLSPSVTTSTSIKLNWQENAGTTAGLGTHITGVDGATNGFDTTATNNPSLYTFNNTSGAWEAVTSTLTNFTAGTPYRLMVRGDRLINLSTNTPTATETVLRATGTLKTGNFSPTLNQAAGGFSFVGNPYQAPVNIKTVLDAATNMNTGVVYYWDPTLNARGGYVTLDLTNNNTNVTSNFNQYLQPGQAVFVKKANTPTAASVTITESHKSVANGAAGVFRTTSPNDYGLLRVNLQANTNNQWQTIEGTLALFNDNFSWNVTSEDATKMSNLDEEVSFVQNNTSLAIACVSAPSVTSELPIQLNNLRHSNYQWQFELANYQGERPYLFDAQNNTYTEITNGATVPFTATTAAANRFKIVFQPSALNADDFTHGLVLYPNPAKAGDSFYVQGSTAAEVTVYNVLGQHIPVQVKSQGNALQVTPMQTLSQGIYLVTVTTEGKTQHVKWIVE